MWWPQDRSQEPSCLGLPDLAYTPKRKAAAAAFLARRGEHRPHPKVLGELAGGSPLTTPNLGQLTLNTGPGEPGTLSRVPRPHLPTR